MSTKTKQEAQNPLILRCQRLMEAFGKSDDERDFYLDRLEGFIIYVDLDKPYQDLDILEKEIAKNNHRYCLIPKLTFYETKKIMEGFVNEKVYDIDTKEKLLDIIQSKEARENFLEFIYDHHAELEKWQQYYQERSRIRIIEWLRNNHFTFVFEEDLDFPKILIEKLKKELFNPKAGKDILSARKALVTKAKTYYSNEALNPRPKRGRPPKQAAKLEVEHQISTDIYTTVPQEVFPFLFTPDYTSSSAVTFSSKFESEEEMMASRRSQVTAPDMNLESLNQKLATLRSLSSRWMEAESKKMPSQIGEIDFDIEEEDEEEEEKEAWIKPVKTKASKPKEINNAIPTKPKKLPPNGSSPSNRNKPKPTQKPAPLRSIIKHTTSESSKKKDDLKPKVITKPARRIISKPLKRK